MVMLTVKADGLDARRQAPDVAVALDHLDLPVLPEGVEGHRVLAYDRPAELDECLVADFAAATSFARFVRFAAT